MKHKPLRSPSAVVDSGNTMKGPTGLVRYEVRCIHLSNSDIARASLIVDTEKAFRLASRILQDLT